MFITRCQLYSIMKSHTPNLLSIKGFVMAYKIIVVDDEIRIRSGIVSTFPWGALGYEIAADFESSLRALEYISTHTVDVVLTDIKMPIMDGIELAQKIKKLNEHVEIVFISGFREFSYAKSAIALGIREYITKPINREEVIALFKRLKLEMDKSGAASLPQQESAPLYYEKIISTVKEYVCSHLAEATLEGAALEAGLSGGYLSKLFKQRTGLNFSDYALNCRMERALTLLSDTVLKSYEIAELVGYDNPKNFSRSFKQYYGISPREYRENGLGGASL